MSDFLDPYSGRIIVLSFPRLTMLDKFPDATQMFAERPAQERVVETIGRIERAANEYARELFGSEKEAGPVDKDLALALFEDAYRSLPHYRPSASALTATRQYMAQSKARAAGREDMRGISTEPIAINPAFFPLDELRAFHRYQMERAAIAVNQMKLQMGAKQAAGRTVIRSADDLEMLGAFILQNIAKNQDIDACIAHLLAESNNENGAGSASLTDNADAGPRSEYPSSSLTAQPRNGALKTKV